jgi:Rrf2 family protein
MKLSQATTYALHALAYLVRHEEGRPVASHVIARAQGIPEKYLLKLLNPLAESGVLQSLRGPNGGYRLARKSKDISLLEVIETLDGPLQRPITFAGKDAKVLGARLQEVCDQATEAVRRQYQRVRLADLVGKL